MGQDRPAPTELLAEETNVGNGIRSVSDGSARGGAPECRTQRTVDTRIAASESSEP